VRSESLRELLTVRGPVDIKPFSNGMQFPLYKFTDTPFNKFNGILVCIISFTCSACIDLLPHLNELSNKINYSLLIFTNATEEEKHDVISYFGFKFPFVHLSDNEFKMLRYPKTPFIYLLNEDYEVITSSIINNIEDIYKISSIA